MTSNTIKTVLNLLDSGDFYSGHQKSRTSAIRLLNNKNNINNNNNNNNNSIELIKDLNLLDKKTLEAIELLWLSSKKLLELNQIGSGSDLSCFLIEIYNKKNLILTDELRAQVIQLIALIGPSGSWRKTFTDAVFSWTSKTGSGAAGDSAIHGYYGEVLFKEKNYHLATLHLLLSPTQDSARVLADVMFQWSKLDSEGFTAVGRYAARGTLSYLESENILPAKIFLAHFLSLTLTAYPQLQVVSYPFPPPSSPLYKSNESSTTSTSSEDSLIMTKLSSLNFLQLTVINCQIGVGEAIEKTKAVDGTMKGAKGKGKLNWMTVLARYERDVSWLKKGDVKDSTQQLSQMYFGIKPPRPAGNAMMDMLSGMFSGGAPGGGGGMPAITGR